MTSLFPWKAVRLYQGIRVRRKDIDNPEVTGAVDIPAYIARLSNNTQAYENLIRVAWEDFKRDPSEAKAAVFAEYLRTVSADLWPTTMADVLGLELAQLSPTHREVLDMALNQHHSYITHSLLPDVVKAFTSGRLSSLDYRTTFLYAGALWAFGSLATVLFDGLSLRDLGDIFAFAGPNDERTCTGDRGCDQYAGRLYTVAQILIEDIIPGHLRCHTNCRHMLIPIASFPEKQKAPPRYDLTEPWINPVERMLRARKARNR